MKKNSDLNVKLDNLSDKPGCYIFKDRDGRIIYIGKAASLKKRVKSYFQKGAKDPKTEKLISHIADVEFFITSSEKEALLLESNLIKEHKPRYNIGLKDDKRYPFVKITTYETYPRLLVVRRIQDDKAKYFGPYTNVTAMRRTLKLVRRIFPIRSCSLELPSRRKYRVCLDYFIGRCPGCCEEGKATPESYNAMIDEVIMFLSGRSREIAGRLRKRMEQFSDELRFEEAAKVRDQLQAIESVIQKQHVVISDMMDRDAISVAIEGKDACVALYQVREGALIGQKHFIVDTAGFEIPDIVRNFIPRYYKTETVFPKEILIPESFDDMDLIEDFLEDKSSRKIIFVIPQKGGKADILRMALSNAKHNLGLHLAQKSAARKKAPHAVYSLARDFYLEKLPRKIAACDISNLGKDNAVGSVVYFSDGSPRKSEYRRMRIKTIEGQDDFTMMKEIVGRYFTHLAENGRDNPDLLLVDGGKGQLSAALAALKDLNIPDQQTVALAKKYEEVYLPGRSQPISLPRTSSSIKLLQKIRNEAHRFAVSYHRKLRSKKLTESELDIIPGIGEKRKMDLLAAFGSVERIRKSSLEDLRATPNLPQKVARSVWEHFNRREKND
ncbi:MAG: excinuclease ABC subunit UvrC [Candidatus Zixiibacteriota bacterium]|nr:MAG: excinuclease ABC subunit UvrC [candidate division Zixibacteria bacterium]